MTGVLRFLLTLSVLALAGCDDLALRRQTRVCRLAAVALSEGAVVGIVRQSALTPIGPGGIGIRLELKATDPAWAWLECRFAAPNAEGTSDLAQIRSPAGVLPASRLFVLKRYWLDKPDAATVDPMPDEGSPLPVLPPAAAYAVQQALNALPNAALYGLLAAAYALIYGLSGRINLAFGELAATGGYAALTGAALLGSGAPLVAALATAAIVGAWTAAWHGAAVEKLTVWPLRGAAGQQGLVASVGAALFLQEYLRLSQGSQPKWADAPLNSPVALARAGVFVVTTTPLALALAAAAALATFALLALLRWSRFGREWRATADDAGAAALFGVDPKRLSLATFMLASAFVGLAGAGVTVYFGGLGAIYTTTLGLKALIGAVVGGIGSVSGAVLGGFAIALIEAFWSAYLPIGDRDLVIDALLVIMLVFRPGGLFGYRDLLPRRV